MEQNKITILSTGRLKQSLLDFASSKNIHIQDLAFIETMPVTSEDLSRRIVGFAHQRQTVVFTSERAVESVAGVLGDPGPVWNIYSLGTATKRSVEKHFHQSIIGGTADSAGALAELIVGQKNIFSVIFFCGDKRRPELPDKLRAGHIQVNEVEVYKTLATPRVTVLHYAAIIFFSPSAVKSFFSVNKMSAETLCFAIGQTTAEEIARHTSNKIIISGEPSKEALVRRAIDHFQTNTIHY
jgi:uroporphyrinogen-III synthase